MAIPAKLKSPRFWWWLLCDAALGITVYYRRGFIFSQTPILPDLILFGAFGGLALLPLFREIEFGGLKLTPELDRLAGEVQGVKDSINLLHTQVLTAVSFRNTQSNQLYIQSTILPDKLLVHLKEQAAPELKHVSPEEPMRIDEKVGRLAAIHFEIAK